MHMLYFIGWSSDHFNDPRFGISLEANSSQTMQLKQHV